MKTRFACAILVTGLLVTAPLRANAANYRAVYDAVITDGTDDDGIFGLLSQNLLGLGLRADITYSASVPGTQTSAPGSNKVSSGFNFGTPPVISSALFTVGYSSFSFSPDD